MDLSVILVFLTLVCVGFSQNEDGTQDAAVAVESAVCDVCVCSGRDVDCSDKEIKKIFDDGSWTAVNNSEVLDIDFSRNPLNVLNVVPDLPINTLNLSRCELGEIVEGAFRNLEELGTLDLSWNQLSTAAVSKRIFGFYSTFEPGNVRPSFINMRNLSLAHNDIHALPKDIFMFMAGLRMLDLSGNPLVAIDQVTLVALSDLKLTELRLAGCELESLPDGLLRRQRKLRRLDLSDNRFTTVPAVLSEAALTLVYLDFNKNSLTNLTERTAISNLTKLEELHLCKQSKLQAISAGALGGLESLTVLHVTHNPRLMVIEPGFLAFEDEHGSDVTPKLQELYLNNNNISSIDYHFLDSWSELTRADFSNNPFVCDCSNQWMVDVLVPLLQTMNCSAANMMSTTLSVLPEPYLVGALSSLAKWVGEVSLMFISFIKLVFPKSPSTTSTGGLGVVLFYSAGNHTANICKKPKDMGGITFETLWQTNRSLVCPDTKLEMNNSDPGPDMAILLGVMIGIFVTFPIVLIVVLLWKRGYFERCRQKISSERVSQYDDDDAF